MLKCCDRLAEACKCWANNVAICCVDTLRSFGRGFTFLILCFSPRLFLHDDVHEGLSDVRRKAVEDMKKLREKSGTLKGFLRHIFL